MIAFPSARHTANEPSHFPWPVASLWLAEGICVHRVPALSWTPSDTARALALTARGAILDGPALRRSSLQCACWCG